MLAAADENFIGSYLKLAQHQPEGAWAQFGPATAFVTGIRLAMFNGCIVPARIAPEALGAAADWLDEREMGHRFWIRDDVGMDAPAVLAARGYVRRAWAMPAMAMRPIPTAPPPAAGVTVRSVDDADALEEHIRMQVDGGMPDEIARRVHGTSFLSDPDVRIFTAYLGRRPVGNSIAIRTGEVSGVYAVGTRPEAQRRGVGTAATWAAVEAGRDWGCSMVTLQSSEMGESVYRAMGFEELARYSMFDRKQ